MRYLARAFVLVAAAALSSALAPRPAAAQAARVVPLVDCISYDPAADEVTAWLGYRYTGAADRTVPIGGNNLFDPGPTDRGQPTVFTPGQFLRVVRVTVPADSLPLIWFVDGNLVEVMNDPAQYCSPLVEGPPGPPGPAFDPATLRFITVESNTRVAEASCAENEFLMTGGGGCGNHSSDEILFSGPTGTQTWRVRCSRRRSRATAQAICAPRP
jgi:hypothetical protein